MKSTVKVGLLLMVFVALTLGAFQILGKSLFSRKHRTYYVKMADAGGLVEGTKVLMAGVQIGTIRQVALINPHEARLTLSLREEILLPVGSIAVIPGSLVGFGETQLTVVSPGDSSGYLPELSTIQGTKQGPLDSFLPDGGKSIVSNIDKSLDSLRKLIQDQGLQKQLKLLLTTANQTLLASQVSLARFNALSDRTTNLISSNQGNLQSMVASMKSSLQNVNLVTGTLVTFLKGGKLQNGTTELLAKASHIEDQTSELMARLNKISDDPALQANVNKTVDNVAKTTESGPKIAENVNTITKNVAEITENSKDLPGRLKDVMDKTSKLEDNLNTLVDRFNGVKAPNTDVFKNLHTELDLIRETNPGYWRTDVNLTYPIKTGYITFGVYDAFESNKINLQVARSFGHSFDLRYGIYASKAGIGVDYNLTRRLSLRTDLFDINSLELDARFRYDFGGGFIGWVGVDRTFEKSVSPNFGIGIVQ